MRASIRDVAQRAGVSPMTVSNVLRRRSGRLSEETRLRVVEALQELNYIPVRSAVQNRHVTTHAIGVVFLQSLQGFVGQRTFWGMSERARELDHDLLIVLRSQPNWMATDVAAQFLDRRCDGYVIVGSFQPELSAMLAAHEVPVVECYSVHPPAGVTRVVGDDAGAMRLAVEALWDRGHRRIAHLGGPVGDGEADLRCAAFRADMAERGANASGTIRRAQWRGLDCRNRPIPELCSLVEAARTREVTAVVCANDGLALDLWQAAEELGLNVPTDLSITGMDNTEQGSLQGLASLAVSFEQIGRAAVEALLARARGEDCVTTGCMIPAELILRRSVAPASPER